MLTDIMDFDPRITSDGCGYGAAYGVHCNFHYGYIHDVFEEDAISEEACVQTLQHLIAKKDADIEFLEVELAILQCEIKCSEPDDQISSCEVDFTALQQKINSLSSFVRTRSSNQNVLNGHDIHTILEKQTLADTVYIDDMDKIKFTEHDEQVGDLSDENSLLVCSDILFIDMDLKQQDTVLESMLESTEQTTVLDKASHDEGSLKETDLQPGESENCMATSETETSGTGMPSLAAYTEVIVKVENYEYDIPVDGVHSESYPVAPDYEGKETVEGHLWPLENQSDSVSDLDITYTRRKSSLCTVLKPDGHKEQREIFGGSKQTTSSLTLKPQKKIAKKLNSSTEEKFAQSEPAALNKHGRLQYLPVKKRHREPGTEGDIGTEDDIACGNPEAFITKRSEPKQASRERCSNQTSNVRIPKQLPGPMGVLALPSPGVITPRVLGAKESSEPIRVYTERYSNQSPKAKICKGLLIPKGVLALLSPDGINPSVLEANEPESIATDTGSSSILSAEVKISERVSGLKGLPSPDGLTPPVLGSKGLDLIGAGTESCTVQSPEAKLSEGIVGPKEVLTLPSPDGTSPLVSRANGLEPKVNSMESSSILLSNVKLSKRRLLTERGLAVKSPNGRLQGLKPLNISEVKASVNAINPDRPLAFKSNTAKKRNRPEMPIIDLGVLKQKIAEEPKLLYTMKVAELRAILAQCKCTGISKLTKDKLIDVLTNLMATV